MTRQTSPTYRSTAKLKVCKETFLPKCCYQMCIGYNTCIIYNTPDNLRIVIVNVLHMLDVVSSENREKTLRFVLTFHGQATDRLPTHYQQSADCRSTVGRQVAYISGKTCRPTVGRQLTESRPTGFLGSSLSQLPSVHY